MIVAPLSTLAVVRCGDQSLHPSWSGEDRLFDIGISYFGDDHAKIFPEAKFVHRGKGGKWDGLFDFFQHFPETVEKYDYFWFPDDDIFAQASDINRLLQIGLENGLEVFQPSLDDKSYYSHLITLKHPSFDLRFTNFVEIMAPVISRDLLKQTLPLLEKSRSGFGMDFLWPKMAVDKSGTLKSAAIVDSVSVRHTRPVGGSLHQLMKKVGGRSAIDEMTDTLESSKLKRSSLINGVAVPRIRILSGLHRSGTPHSGLRLSLDIAWDLTVRYVNNVQPVKSIAAIKHALKAASN